MTKQIAFLIFLAAALGVFSFTIYRLSRYFSFTKKGFKVDRIPERIKTTLRVAFGQTKIMRRPVVGAMHALVWWGFLVVTVGTGEMVLDGLSGHERILSFMGPVYDIIIASGDIFAIIIIVMISIFLFRRHVIHVKRLGGIEMTTKSSVDATVALFFIMFLMVSLLGMNVGYLATHVGEEYAGAYPISGPLLKLMGPFSENGAHMMHEVNWWAHIVLVFTFMNVLPYSKHFHVFMSVPNVFLTDLKPLTKLHNMPAVTKEVELMMNPDTAFAPPAEGEPTEPPRFGVKDIEDITWKNYIDSLTCTECGRCTSVCPANTTGKLLSPRKIMKNTRARMAEKGPGKIKDPNYDDGRSLIHDYITTEELLACTTCNACVQECPVDIDQVSIIVDLRRYLIMEEAQSPPAWNAMFSNIENNGAPWQFSPEDRFNWADNIEMNVVEA